MLSSKGLKEIVTIVRPIIERQLDDAEQIAAFRDKVAASGGDWSALKALIKAQIQDERDEAGGGKRVKKILDKAGFSTGYAELLGWSNMNEKNFSAGEEFDPLTGEFIDDNEASDGSPAVLSSLTTRETKTGRPIGSGEAQRFLRDVVFTYEGDDCLIWPFARQKNGYAQIGYEGRTQIVSRIVCERSNGPAPTPDHHAAHTCGNGSNGCVNMRHLLWKTRAENEADKIDHGTACLGERNPQAVLTEDDVAEIRRLRGEFTTRQIGDMFGISQTTVSAIHVGKRWGWLPEESVVSNPEMDRATEGSFETGSEAAEKGREAIPAGPEGADLNHAGAGESPETLHDQLSKGGEGAQHAWHELTSKTGEGAASALPAKPKLRPNCQRPGETCGGYGDKHCHDCLRSMREYEAA